MLSPNILKHNLHSDLIFYKTCFKNRAPLLNINNLAIFSDFDYTITNKYHESFLNQNQKNLIYTTFSMIENSSFISDKFRRENRELFNKFHHVEQNISLDYEEKKAIIKEWFTKNRLLLLNEKLSNKCLMKIAKEINKHIKFRSGFADFLNYIYEYNIPFYIISAGLQDSIDALMELNFKTQIDRLRKKNLYKTLGNKLVFDKTGRHVDFTEPIYSYNKSEILLKNFNHTEKNQYIMLGDNILDANTLDLFEGDKVTIGFGNLDKFNYYTDPIYEKFVQTFDVSIINQGSFNSVINFIDDYYIKH